MPRPPLADWGKDVFGQAAAIEEDHGHRRSFVVGFDAPGEAFFGEQAGNEDVIAFIVLNAIAALTRVDRMNWATSSDQRQAATGEFGEDSIDDLDDGFFLEDAVVAVAGGEPDPGDYGQAIAAEATVGRSDDGTYTAAALEFCAVGKGGGGI